MNESDGFAWIDRLATADLDDDARRKLFLWLDSEPRHWRRCALAMLESRELEQAFAQWRASDERPVSPSQRHGTRARFRRSLPFALAASVLIAFTLGVFARGFWPAPVPRMAAAAGHADQKPQPPANEERSTGSQVPAPVAVRQPTKPAEKLVATASPQGNVIPPYIRSQWERHGYQVKSQQVKVPVVLPDGHRLLVPGNEVHLNYVGQRTY